MNILVVYGIAMLIACDNAFHGDTINDLESNFSFEITCNPDFSWGRDNFNFVSSHNPWWRHDILGLSPF